MHTLRGFFITNPIDKIELQRLLHSGEDQVEDQMQHQKAKNSLHTKIEILKVVSFRTIG